MAAFSCDTRDLSGSSVQRTVEASTRSEAMKLLEADGLFPIEIREVQGERGASTRSKVKSTESKSTNGNGARQGRRVKSRDLLAFSRHLGSSIGAGVSIPAAVASLASQATDPSFQATLKQVQVDIEGGLPLSAALRNHPRAFPEVYASTVAAGEQSGDLAAVLDHLVEYVEMDMDLRADVRSAMMYPAIVVTSLTLAIGALVLFVVPRFAAFYSGFNSALPLPTRVLITGSQLMSDYFLLVALGVVAAIFGLRHAASTERGRRAIDRVLLRVPLFGHLIVTASTLRVAQMIGLFTQTGVPLLRGLETTAKATNNTDIARRLRGVARSVEEGMTLAAGMEKAQCLPPSARQMIAAGESTGTLEGSCFAVAAHFKKELRYLTKNLATLIEPVLTLVLAVVVLFVALAVFLPMWDLVKVVR